jgi:phage terminase Nu1 subunit (DNA packaging protein)
MNPSLVTAAELAATYRVGKRTISAWHRAGVIPAALVVGKVIRFDPAAVAKALAKRTASSR